MLAVVELAGAPDPLHAVFVSAVAVARKLAVLIWDMLTKETDYLWARPTLVSHKMRGMEVAGR
jgi:hypothetical protein